MIFGGKLEKYLDLINTFPLFTSVEEIAETILAENASKVKIEEVD